MKMVERFLEKCRDFLFPPQVSSPIKIAVFGGSGVGKTVYLTSLVFFNSERKDLRHQNDREIQDLHLGDDRTREYFEKHKRDLFVNRCPVEGNREPVDLRFKVLLENMPDSNVVLLRDICGGFVHDFMNAEEKLKPEITSTDGALLFLPAHLAGPRGSTLTAEDQKTLDAFQVQLEMACRARQAKYSRWGVSQYPIALVVTQKDRIPADKETEFNEHLKDKIKTVGRFINEKIQNGADFFTNLVNDYLEGGPGKEKANQNARLFVCKACGDWQGNRPPPIESILPEHLDSLSAPIAFLIKRIRKIRANARMARNVGVALIFLLGLGVWGFANYMKDRAFSHWWAEQMGKKEYLSASTGIANFRRNKGFLFPSNAELDRRLKETGLAWFVSLRPALTVTHDESLPKGAVAESDRRLRNYRFYLDAADRRLQVVCPEEYQKVEQALARETMKNHLLKLAHWCRAPIASEAWEKFQEGVELQENPLFPASWSAGVDGMLEVAAKTHLSYLEGPRTLKECESAWLAGKRLREFPLRKGRFDDLLASFTSRIHKRIEEIVETAIWEKASELSSTHAGLSSSEVQGKISMVGPQILNGTILPEFRGFLKEVFDRKIKEFPELQTRYAFNVFMEKAREKVQKDFFAPFIGLEEFRTKPDLLERVKIGEEELVNLSFKAVQREIGGKATPIERAHSLAEIYAESEKASLPERYRDLLKNELKSVFETAVNEILTSDLEQTQKAVALKSIRQSMPPFPPNSDPLKDSKEQIGKVLGEQDYQNLLALLSDLYDAKRCDEFFAGLSNLADDYRLKALKALKNRMEVALFDPTRNFEDRAYLLAVLQKGLSVAEMGEDDRAALEKTKTEFFSKWLEHLKSLFRGLAVSYSADSLERLLPQLEAFLKSNQTDLGRQVRVAVEFLQKIKSGTMIRFYIKCGKLPPHFETPDAQVVWSYSSMTGKTSEVESQYPEWNHPVEIFWHPNASPLKFELRENDTFGFDIIFSGEISLSGLLGFMNLDQRIISRQGDAWLEFSLQEYPHAPDGW